ncbi:MAG TPA: Gfo/Idh/MocA family oxidoreductase, partial [Limnochordia bacterium]|nr:Gfo/Idh/MocA family oxidoreductase [Limnochordia bacterium]
MLRAGLIGAGRMGSYHGTVFRRHDQTELVAIAEVDPERLAAAGKRFGVDACYPDYRTMLEREALDVVTIATQAPQHHDAVVAAALAGVHILCEKPIALDPAQADAMVAAAERAGVVLAINHQIPLGPAPQLAKAMLEGGEIGELLRIRCFPGKGRPASYELMEMGIHAFDHARFYAGDPLFVTAYLTRAGRAVNVQDIMPSREFYPQGRDCGLIAGDQASALFGFERGIPCHVECDPLPKVDQNATGIELHGTRGALKLCGGRHEQLFHLPHPVPDLGDPQRSWRRVDYDESRPAEVPADLNPEHLQSLMRVMDALVDAALGRPADLRTGRDGRAALEMIMGIYAAHFAGKRIALPLPDR